MKEQASLYGDRIKIEGDTSTTEIPPNLRDLTLAIETGSWDKTAAVLRRLREEGEDPEGLRRGVLLSEKAFCRGKRSKSRIVIDALRELRNELAACS